MLYRSKNDADNSVNDPIGGPDEINRKDSMAVSVAWAADAAPIFGLVICGGFVAKCYGSPGLWARWGS